MATETRIYRVTAPGVVRLVEASSQAQAVAFVTRPFTAAIATQRDLVHLIRDGMKVEDPNAKEDL